MTIICDIKLGDNLPILREVPSNSVDLIYIDPPFNTGIRQERERLEGEPSFGYDDKFEDLVEFLRPRMVEAHRVLKPNGSLFFHIDYRESHYCKVMLDEIFGRRSFINEIIWAYDYGGRAKRRWSQKHNTIFFYAKDPENYTFNYDAIDRIPYMAPGLVTPEKVEKGKTPTSVWWMTIVSPMSKEKTGYATQKPLKLLERIVRVHSKPGDTCLDFFAGSGTLGEASLKNGRSAVLIDSNDDAVTIMKERLRGVLRNSIIR